MTTIQSEGVELARLRVILCALVSKYGHGGIITIDESDINAVARQPLRAWRDDENRRYVLQIYNGNPVVFGRSSREDAAETQTVDPSILANRVPIQFDLGEL